MNVKQIVTKYCYTLRHFANYPTCEKYMRKVLWIGTILKIVQTVGNICGYSSNIPYLSIVYISSWHLPLALSNAFNATSSFPYTWKTLACSVKAQRCSVKQLFSLLSSRSWCIQIERIVA